MSRLVAKLMAIGGAVVVSASVAFANEPKSGAPDYTGITGMYYAFIGLVLAYGVYDTFFKKS